LRSKGQRAVGERSMIVHSISFISKTRAAREVHVLGDKTETVPGSGVQSGAKGSKGVLQQTEEVSDEEHFRQTILSVLGSSKGNRNPRVKANVKSIALKNNGMLPPPEQEDLYNHIEHTHNFNWSPEPDLDLASEYDVDVWVYKEKVAGRVSYVVAVIVDGDVEVVDGFRFREFAFSLGFPHEAEIASPEQMNGLPLHVELAYTVRFPDGSSELDWDLQYSEDAPMKEGWYASVTEPDGYTDIGFEINASKPEDKTGFLVAFLFNGVQKERGVSVRTSLDPGGNYNSFKIDVSVPDDEDSDEDK